MNILLIDNYDSFTHNLAHGLRAAGACVTIAHNDAITLPHIAAQHFDGIVLSPGPGTPLEPSDVGICSAIVQQLAGVAPILGVCLGHQLIAHLYGATIEKILPHHGEVHTITPTGPSVLFPAARACAAARYHSLAVASHGFPAALRVTARAKDGAIMAIEHNTLPLFGVQFHPESVGTPTGQALLRRFVGLCANVPHENTTSDLT